MPRQTHSAFARELAKHDDKLAQAFLEAVQNITSQAQIRAIDAAIASGNVQRVMLAISLDVGFWAPLDRAFTETFINGALWQQGQMPKKLTPAGLSLRVGFNHRNPRAEQWNRTRAADFVTEITRDTRLGIRSVVQEGIEQGWGVTRTRNTLIGVMRGNQRQGGVIGLHSRDVAAVIRARRELSDPGTLAEYLRRLGQAAPGRVTVRAAIRAERPLTASEIDDVARSYADRLLRVRGNRIARTEAHNAFSAGMFESVQQMIDSGKVPASAVSLVWQSTVGSVRTRDTHRRMNADTVSWGEPFTSPSGAMLRYPGDSSLGAPGAETINCRCGIRPDVDFVSLAV